MRFAAAAAALVLAAWASGAAGRDLATLWLDPPDHLLHFLAGGRHGTAAGATAWLAASHSALAGVDELRQTCLEAGFEGRVRCSAGWQRTGSADGPWSEHRLDGRLGRSGLPLALVGSRRATSCEGAPWPAAWDVSIEATVRPSPGVRLSALVPVASKRRPWAMWGGARRFSFAAARRDARLTVALVDGATDRPAARVQAWTRPAVLTGLGLGWDASTGETALLIALRRGGLLIRSRHSVHPLTGVEHVWQVAWSRGVRP